MEKEKGNEREVVGILLEAVDERYMELVFGRLNQGKLPACLGHASMESIRCSVHKTRIFYPR